VIVVLDGMRDAPGACVWRPPSSSAGPAGQAAAYLQGCLSVHGPSGTPTTPRVTVSYTDLNYAHFPHPTPRWSRSSWSMPIWCGKENCATGPLSNHLAWQVTQALWIADDRHLSAAPVSAQVKYHLVDRLAEDELASACQQFGLSILPFGPLHGALLAGMPSRNGSSPGTRDSVGPGSLTSSWRSAVLSSG
jgi:aryl-alcohol dehydrogenase-like predicted oxidoreductase